MQTSYAPRESHGVTPKQAGLGSEAFFRYGKFVTACKAGISRRIARRLGMLTADPSRSS